MTITFNDETELLINSYGEQEDGSFIFTLYTDDYTWTRDRVYKADKSNFKVTMSDESEYEYSNYTKITNFIGSEVDGHTHITVKLEAYVPDYKELLAEQERLIKENKELKAKMAKIK